jgi:O-antigen ligase
VSWYQATIGDRFDLAARAMVVLSAFAIPLSTAVMGVSTVLLLVFWLLSGNFRIKFQRIITSPISLWAIGLFLLLAIGLLYTTAETEAALDTFGKYKKLLFVPIIISLMLSDQWRRYAIMAFAIAMTIVLVMSYLKYLEVLPYGPVGQEYTVFKGRIAHGIFMAFFFYLLVQFALWYPRWRWLFITLAALAVYNLLFLNTGRTGYVVFICLAILLFYQYVGWKGLLISAVAVPLLLVIAFYTSSDFKMRVQESVTDVEQYAPGEYDHFSGLRYRLEYYQTTLKVIKKSILYGHGTGSLATEFKKIADEEGLRSTDNPHNEFMMLTAQLGIIGLLVFCLMLYFQWRNCCDLDKEYRLIMQGVLVTMISGSMLNSLLLDSGEGKFYVILLAIVFSVPAKKLRAARV